MFVHDKKVNKILNPECTHAQRLKSISFTSLTEAEKDGASSIGIKSYSWNDFPHMMQYQMHLAEMEAAKAGMPVVSINHDNIVEGPTIKDIHMENFNVSVGGRDLIVDDTVTLSFGRHYGIVKELLGMLPELCKSCDSLNTSPLYSAAEMDHLEVVNAILDADVRSIKIVQKNGKTTLHNAVRYGLLRVVKTLLDRDPEIVSIKDKKGQTALHMAVKAMHIATRKCHPQETAMDLANKLNYGKPAFEIKEALTEAGATYARHVDQLDEAMELKRTVSDIKHEVYSQLIQSEKTQRRVSGIAKELEKIHQEAVQNSSGAVTVSEVWKMKDEL